MMQCNNGQITGQIPHNGGIGICKSPGAMSFNILYMYREILLNLNLRDQMRLGNANGRELIVHNMNVVHKI